MHLLLDSTLSEVQWIDFIERNRLKNVGVPNELRLEIRQSFIEPYQIVSLACLIEEFDQVDVPIVFSRNHCSADMYLNHVRFFEYWTQGFDRHAFITPGKRTTFALWKISQSRISMYADESKKYFENLVFTGKDLTPLHIALSETFNNIFDHAESPVDGFVLYQYFPRVHRINTAICDFGVGIPSNIKTIWSDRLRTPVNDEDALRAAFINRMSTKTTPQNRGFGLSNLLGNIRNINGELIVYSNAAGIRFFENKVYYRSLPRALGGTLVKFSFDPSNLPKKEAEVDNEEFFSKVIGRTMNSPTVDINLIEVTGGTSTNPQGAALYVVLKRALLDGNKIRLSLKDASPMSSSFLNSSFGELIDEFGLGKVRSSISLVHYTASQANTLKAYFAAYERYVRK